jgi:hypothetical protein
MPELATVAQQAVGEQGQHAARDDLGGRLPPELARADPEGRTGRTVEQARFVVRRGEQWRHVPGPYHGDDPLDRVDQRVRQVASRPVVETEVELVGPGHDRGRRVAFE